MKKISLLLTILCVFLCASGCIKDKVEDVELKVGDRLPDFSVVMNDGTVVSDESLKGSVSFVMFFHTTCPDCQKTLPVVNDIYDIYVSEGVRFALISREQDEADILTYWNEKAYDMPFSAQSDRTIYNKFATSRIPRIYISDKDGIIRYIYTDNPVPDYESLDQALKALTGLDVE